MEKKIQDSGNRMTYQTGAQRDLTADKGQFCLMPFEAIERLAKHYEGGAAKYAPRNWEKGIPLSVYMNSASRHLFKWMCGWLDEDHEAATMWNIAGFIWTRERIIDGSLPISLLLEDKFLHPILKNEIVTIMSRRTNVR